MPRPSLVHENTLHGAMQAVYGELPELMDSDTLAELTLDRLPRWLDSAIVLACHADAPEWKQGMISKSFLSPYNMVRLLTTLESISTETVQSVLHCQTRQAQRYMRGCKLVIDRCNDLGDRFLAWRDAMTGIDSEYYRDSGKSC